MDIQTIRQLIKYFEELRKEASLTSGQINAIGELLNRLRAKSEQLTEQDSSLQYINRRANALRERINALKEINRQKERAIALERQHEQDSAWAIQATRRAADLRAERATGQDGDPGRNIRNFYRELRRTGVPREAVREIIAEFNKLGITIDTITEKAIKFGLPNERGFRRLTFDVKQLNGVLVPVSKSIDVTTGKLRTQAQAAEETARATRKLTEQEKERLRQQQPAVFQRAAQAGFGTQTLQNVIREGSTGISRYMFAYRDAQGVMQRFTSTVNDAGVVLVDTQKRFRTFFQGIGRDFREALKWAVAIQLIYGPLRKLNELIELSIKNETELANATVVLGRSQADTRAIFDAAADAAEATGESISGVLEGYTLAFRATGGYTNEVERAAVAQQLLVDSLTLSKLSSLDQARAMDTLVGALTQLDLGLDQGRDLLDSWVKISRVANVSVDTLAESFAITATAAENAGLSMEELNAVIAVVAETTTLSATESGNAVRAFISGFQSDNARQELAQFGVSITDASGEVRSFLSIATEVKALFDAGLISQDQLNRIATAIGGRGARRGAQVQAFLENLGRVEELTAAQADRAGEAQDALAIKLDTVQTKLTEVSNAFQTLAQGIGDEGGILSVFKFLLDLVEGVIEAFDGLTRVLGPASPLLAIGGGLTAYFRSQGTFATEIAKAGNILGTIGGRVPGIRTGLGALYERQTGFPQGLPLEQVGRQGGGAALAESFRRNAPLAGVAMAEAFLAVINISEGDWNGLGGQVAGGIIGAMLTGGSPIGILIGSVAGEALVNKVMDFEAEFQNLFSPTSREERIEQQAESLTATDKAFSDLFETIGRGNESFGRSLAGSLSLISQAFNALPFIGGGEIFPELTPEQAGLSILGMNYFTLFTPDQKNQILRELQEIQERATAQGEGYGPVTTPVVDRIKANVEANQAVISRLTDEMEEDLREAFQAGDVSAKEFRDTSTFLETFGINITTIFTALQDTILDTDAAYSRFARTMFDATPQQREEIAELSATINNLKNELAELQAAGDITATGAIQSQIQQQQDVLNSFIEGIRRTQIQQEISIPATIDISQFDPQEQQLIIAEARRIAAQEAQEYLKSGLAPDDATEEIVRSTFQDLWIKVAEDRDRILIEGIDSSMWQDAIQRLTDTGQIDEPTPLGLRPLDITSQQLPGLMQQYAATVSSIQSQLAPLGIEYFPDETEFIAYLTDGVATPIKADLSILNLLMQELVDVNKKQLDGIYNLPTDASFFVPFTGYRLGPTGGGGIDLSSLLGKQDQELNLDEERNRILNDMFMADRDLKEVLHQRYMEEQERRMDEGPSLRKLAEGATEVPGIDKIIRKGDIKEEVSDYFKSLEKIDGLGRPKTTTREDDLKLDTNFERLGSAIDNLTSTLNRFLGGDLLKSQTKLQDNIQRGSIPETGVSDIPTTNLQLDISQNTNLVVDGRVLAQVLSQHLFEQLIRNEGSRGGAIRLSLLG